MEGQESKRVGTLGATLVEWTARVGADAAAHRVRYYRTWLRAWLFAVFGFVLVLIGGFNDLTVLTILGVAGFVAWGALSVMAVRELTLMNAAIRRNVGVEFGFYGGPPARQEQYVRWCERKGVSPYPFRNVQPPAVKTSWL